MDNEDLMNEEEKEDEEKLGGMEHPILIVDDDDDETAKGEDMPCNHERAKYVSFESIENRNNPLTMHGVFGNNGSNEVGNSVIIGGPCQTMRGPGGGNDRVTGCQCPGDSRMSSQHDQPSNLTRDGEGGDPIQILATRLPREKRSAADAMTVATENIAAAAAAAAAMLVSPADSALAKSCLQLQQRPLAQLKSIVTTSFGGYMAIYRTSKRPCLPMRNRLAYQASTSTNNEQVQDCISDNRRRTCSTKSAMIHSVAKDRYLLASTNQSTTFQQLLHQPKNPARKAAGLDGGQTAPLCKTKQPLWSSPAKMSTPKHASISLDTKISSPTCAPGKANQLQGIAGENAAFCAPHIDEADPTGNADQTVHPILLDRHGQRRGMFIQLGKDSSLVIALGRYYQGRFGSNAKATLTRVTQTSGRNLGFKMLDMPGFLDLKQGRRNKYTPGEDWDAHQELLTDQLHRALIEMGYAADARRQSISWFLSFMATTRTTEAQAPHIDFTWDEVVDQSLPASDKNHRIINRSRRALQARQKLECPMIAFFPLREDGMFLQVWPDSGKVVEIEEGLLQPEQLTDSFVYGQMVHIPYGYMLVMAGSTIHGGGFRSSPSGNPRVHLYIYKHDRPTSFVGEYERHDARSAWSSVTTAVSGDMVHTKQFAQMRPTTTATRKDSPSRTAPITPKNMYRLQPIRGEPSIGQYYLHCEEALSSSRFC